MSTIQTVLGTIDANLLGTTLTHEHLALDFEHFYCNAHESYQTFLAGKIRLENRGYIQQFPYSSIDNLRLNDELSKNAIIKDLELYKNFGGGAIVENTSYGLNRNLEFLVEAAKRTGVHIIAGTGHYIFDVQRPPHSSLSIEAMSDLYTKEIITGVDVVGGGLVKCGFIGEVGSVYPLRDFEKLSIKATGETQEVLGCGVSFHPGRNTRAPSEIMRLYLEAGGNASKCVMSHMERTIMDFDELLEFAKCKCFIQYDLFGTECSYYQLNPSVDMPSDAYRINNLMKLIEEGLTNQILMSHDIHTKHRLTLFGGHGYHHINMNILPRMFGKGLTVDQMEQITIKNPAHWLELNL